jgi:hypothetical protein
LYKINNKSLFEIELDYGISFPLTITVSAMISGDTFCFNLSAIDDNVFESTEQFKLYFENLPTEFATVGNPSTLCVTIEDRDGKLGYISS